MLPQANIYSAMGVTLNVLFTPGSSSGSRAYVIRYIRNVAMIEVMVYLWNVEMVQTT